MFCQFSFINNEDTFVICRENLDPRNEKTDDQIWTVLSQLCVERSVNFLDEPITEEGQNLSAGQRQLLCIARAFLRDSSILIMDESTSSLDESSEQMLNDLIIKSNKTVVSIAHKISNILSFDTIIVVDKGCVAEVGSPKQLIQNKASIFNTLLFKQKTKS